MKTKQKATVKSQRAAVRSVPVTYPAAQLKALQGFYGLQIQQHRKKAGVSSQTMFLALQGRPTVGLETFAKIADAVNADVVITLRPRDPEFLKFASGASAPHPETTAPPAGGE